MTLIRFDLAVSHSQFSVFDAAHPDFPAWDENHVTQGFAWRDGHVSFGLPDCEAIAVQLSIGENEVDGGTGRLIDVPLSVSSGRIGVASISEEREHILPAGTYQVLFGIDDENALVPVVRLALRPDASSTFTIHRRGGEMTTDRPLRIGADVA